MIAIDSNLLVYAHREDSVWHEAAYRRLTELAEGQATWAIPWPCVHEFIAIVTHPKIYTPSTPLPIALDQVDAWLASPSVILLSHTDQYWSELRTIVSHSRMVGPQIHDAHVAALCLLHQVTELWSADRDFSRFPNLRTRNPLIE